MKLQRRQLLLVPNSVKIIAKCGGHFSVPSTCLSRVMAAVSAQLFSTATESVKVYVSLEAEAAPNQTTPSYNRTYGPTSCLASIASADVEYVGLPMAV